MSDFNSSLPVRTENAGDVIAKIADATVPSQQLAIDASGNAQVEVNNAAGASAVNIQDGGNSITVDATNLDIRDLVFASDKVDVSGSTGVGVTDNGGSLTVDATDFDIRDLTHVSDSVKVGDGTDFIAVNADGSINVNIIDSVTGTPVDSYNTAAALAAAASSNHDYTVTAATTLHLRQVWAAASGKLKAEVQIETGVATGVFNTFWVGFNSTANPNIPIPMPSDKTVAAGVRVRVIRTNLDNQAQDVYSTISGFEV